MDDSTLPVTPDETDPPPTDWEQFAQRWLAEIDYAEDQRKDFIKRGRKITKRYRGSLDRNDPARSGSKLNLFWSNVQTLAPATYSRRPKVEVFRRFRDSDPVARLAGLILERALQYEVDQGLSFHQTMQSTVLDRLLPGQGCVWVRYEPSFQSEDIKVPSAADPMQLETQSVEVLKDEVTPVDYVFWEDFLTSPARVWADVTWVARWVPFTKDQLTKRFGPTVTKFGGTVENIPINFDPLETAQLAEGRSKSTEVDPDLKRAMVAELWDKTSRKIVFLAKGCTFPLDVVEDPAELQDFFPCPPPLLATTTNDEILPVPDFVIYQDQLRELDVLTNRISLLEGALRVIGVYDASQDSLKNLLQSGLENRLVPVQAWAAFAERGGLKGVMDFLPLDQVVKVLEGLYKAREVCKQTIYEITGMSDIIRGASVASETLGAQEIKAKFANLRLSSRQQQVAEFVTHILQLKAQLICKHYSPETLVRISSAQQLEEVQANPQVLGVALQLLKDQKLRSYRIEVAAESMLELDEVDEQKRRNEFMSTVANFFLAAKNIAATAPEMMPVALEMLKFSVRGFPVGRSLEYALDAAVEGIKKRMANPQPQGPDPAELIKLELEKMKQSGEDRRAGQDAQLQIRLKEMDMFQADREAQADRRHQETLAQADRTHSMMEQYMGQQATERQADADRQAEERQGAEERTAESQRAVAALETLQGAIEQLFSTDEKIIEALGDISQLVQKDRKRTPKYDPQTGDITEVTDSIVH